MITYSEAELRAKIIQGMAHPVRLMVIEFLKVEEHTFAEICKLFSLDKSTISKHLSVLKGAGIITARKTGRETIYKLEVPCVAGFFDCATDVINKNLQRQLRYLRG